MRQRNLLATDEQSPTKTCRCDRNIEQQRMQRTNERTNNRENERANDTHRTSSSTWSEPRRTKSSMRGLTLHLAAVAAAATADCRSYYRHRRILKYVRLERKLRRGGLFASFVPREVRRRQRRWRAPDTCANRSSAHRASQSVRTPSIDRSINETNEHATGPRRRRATWSCGRPSVKRCVRYGTPIAPRRTASSSPSSTRSSSSCLLSLLL